MSINRQRKTNHLTRESFELLLAALHEDREQAAARYEQIRHALQFFFEVRGTSSPADDADETLDRVARRLSEGHQIFAANPHSYFYAVARNVWRERLANPHTETEIDETQAGTSYSTPSPHELLESYEDQRKQEKRLACLRKCLGSLNQAERELIENYYQGSGAEKIRNRAQMAARIGIPPSALRSRAMRLRDKLEVCVKRCQKTNQA